jgi:putative DNA primase/helicase
MPLNHSKLENVKQKGSGYIARCPACAESQGDSTGNHLSIDAEGKFACIMFQGASGTEHRKRIYEIAGEPIETKPKDKPRYTALPNAPANAPAPNFRHFKHGHPVKTWRYTNTDSLTAGFVARFDLPTGKKETLPLTWCKDQHVATSWQWKAMTEPRPLLGLPFQTDRIIVVEGEKCTDAVRAASYESTTWAGGCAAISKSDFSTLQGKHVTLWPDNDDPGRRAMKSLAAMLKPIAASISMVSIPDDKPIGWDAADATFEEITSLIDGAAIYDDKPSNQDVFNESESSRDRIHGLPFKLLGVDDGIMRYIPDNGQHIVSLSPSAHTKLNLIQLAPLQLWEDVFPSSNGTNWDAAANSLIQLSLALPKFDPRSIRGRGCWIDQNDIVYHAGDKLSVNGTITSISRYESESIYEGGLKIPIESGDPAKNPESAQLLKLCESLSWEHPLNGKLLAGWMALAPICGALSWRPHIWITGSAGSGKTWIMSNVVNPMAGKSTVFVQGNTSEAGIRCQLGSDALPVLFDEAEAENARSIPRMEGVLELARQASSESGAGIIKGTQTGGSITYMIRSMFCFSSIGVAAVKKADTSRISVLSLRKTDDPSQFETVKQIWRETTAKDGFCARVRARSIRNAIVIRQNAEIFSQCAVNFTGDKRSADQIGTLLAGAYSLTSSRKITAEAAQKWMEQQDWSCFKTDLIDSDENQCWAHLLSSHLQIQREKSTETISIDEAVSLYFDSKNEDYEASLKRIGIKITENGLIIANNHHGLERIFRDTAWAGAKWKGQLLRIQGAEAPKTPVKFGKNVVQRAVFVPFQP